MWCTGLMGVCESSVNNENYAETESKEQKHQHLSTQTVVSWSTVLFNITRSAQMFYKVLLFIHLSHFPLMYESFNLAKNQF